MRRIIWWISFGAKVQGIWLLELIISILFNRFCLKSKEAFREFDRFLICLMAVLWTIVVFVVGFRTWEQTQFQFPVLKVICSSIFFIIARMLSNWLECAYFRKR